MNTTAQYRELVTKFPPRPIRTKAAHARALKLVDRLMTKASRSHAEEELMEVWSTLIGQYEEQHFDIPSVSPAELLAHCIQSRGITNAELSRQVGIPRQRITDAIHGRRPLSGHNAIRVAEFFKLQPSVFVSQRS